MGTCGECAPVATGTTSRTIVTQQTMLRQMWRTLQSRLECSRSAYRTPLIRRQLVRMGVSRKKRWPQLRREPRACVGAGEAVLMQQLLQG